MQNMMWLFLVLTGVFLFAALVARVRLRLLAQPAVAGAESALQRFTVLILRHEMLTVILLFGVAVLVRSWAFTVLPRGQNQDGTMAAVEAFCLMRDGVDHMGHPWPTYFEAWGGTQMSTLYSYILIPFIHLLGLTKLALRLPMLLCSLLAILAGWDLARRALGKGYGLLFLLVAALNPWHILQSRWALEANLMPHVLLVACWLLYLGRSNPWALCFSMVFFGLTPYAYGVATFVTPVLLIPVAVYFVAKRRVRLWQALVCVLIFTAVAGPYFLTLAIQTFEWDTMMIGPFSLPRFYDTMRAGDISLFAENPYVRMVSCFGAFLQQFLVNSYGAPYNEIAWAHTMYPFTVLLYISGLYLWWQKSRKEGRLKDACEASSASEDLFRIISFWLLGAAVNGMLIPGVINRQNAVYYPLMFLTAYGIWHASKRLKLAGCAMAAMLLAAFAGLCVNYFGDEAYQDRVARSFREGLQEALVQTKNWDYDHYYVFDQDKIALTQVMFAHQIDYALLSEEKDLPGLDGQPCGWYFNDRYIIVKDWDEFEPNPMDCAVYIFPKEEAGRFDPEDYEVTTFSNYCAAYPRYWIY